jgi:hypothetical protein
VDAGLTVINSGTQWYGLGPVGQLVEVEQTNGNHRHVDS